MGEETWEKAESKFVELSIKTLLEKAEITPKDVDYIIAGGRRSSNIRPLPVAAAVLTWKRGNSVSGAGHNSPPGSGAYSRACARYCSAF